jgi:hypothetical protein
MKYSEFLKEIDNKNNDLEAVKQNGNALYYVKNQTEAVCLEAVKQDGFALLYVDKTIFDKE